MFWLSHHPPEEHDRCVLVAGVPVCARCLATYPVLFLTIAVQLRARAPLSHPWDHAIAVGLLLPATLDWAWGRFRPHAHTNAWRGVTGALLGVGLGRSLFIHLQAPFPPVLLEQAAVVFLVALPVFLVSYLRNRRS